MIIKEAYYKVFSSVYQPLRRTILEPYSWHCRVYALKTGQLLDNVWIKEEILNSGRRVKPTEKLYERRKKYY